MSLSDYQAQLISCIPASSLIRVTTTHVRSFSESEGRIEIKLTMVDGSELHLAQYVNLEQAEPIRKYSYHYQTLEQAVIFRYDNKPHFRDLPTFPYHKHRGDSAEACARPEIEEVITEALSLVSTDRK